MIEVNCRVIDDSYTAEDRELAALMVNNICDAISAGKYVLGQRNNMAVDLSCMCHVLHLDPNEVAAQAFEDIPNNVLDKVDLRERVDKIDEYLYAWDVYGRNGIFDYLMMEWEWKGEPEHEWVKLINNNQ